MIFSLQRRFVVFLLLPVMLFLLVVAVASFIYARSFLIEQRQSWTILRLEKTAHQIQMRLEGTRKLMVLIGEAEAGNDGKAVQAFLENKLARQAGVEGVEILRDNSRSIKPEGSADGRPADSGLLSRSGYDPADSSVHHAHEAAGSGFVLSVDKSRRFVTMTESIPGTDDRPPKRILVKLALDSLMKGILDAGRWEEGSFACLVSADGTYLAHTMPAMDGFERMGDSGHEIELGVLKLMKRKDFGTVLGKGHPADYVAGFYRIPGTDWFLVLFSEGREALAPLVKFRAHYSLAGLAMLVGVWVLIRLNTRPVAKSIGQIASAAEKVENGDYSAEVPEGGADEVGQLKRRFNAMIRGLRQRELIEKTFGRYVDKNIAQELLTRPEALHMGGEKHDVTILMSDLRGFTSMAEKLRPEDVIRILNRYFARMIAVIDKHRGIIVDFYGDSVLVFFDGVNADISQRAGDAVQCAIEMQEQLEAVSAVNEREGLPRLTMGIGVHSGEVVVGNIGSETRAKYGIVGSAVNETDRIQSYAEAGSVIISEQTKELLWDSIVVGEKISVSLKGLEGTRDLYPVEALDRKP